MTVITTIAAAFIAALCLGFLAEKIKVPALLEFNPAEGIGITHFCIMSTQAQGNIISELLSEKYAQRGF